MRKFIIWLMKLSTNKNQIYKVGEKAPVSALYWAEHTNELIPLTKGERFPPSKWTAANWVLLFSLE